MRFDWYSASVSASSSHCNHSLSSVFGASIIAPCDPLRMYRHAVRVGSRGVRLSWGGHNPRPFVEGTGASADQAARWLRETYPERHGVARADVCLDTVESGAWDHLTRNIEEIARTAGVAVLYVGDPDPVAGTGRTLYYGSVTSAVRVRVYEKGRKERAAGDLDAPEDWVRVEVQVRPQRADKARFAAVPPAGFWAASRWTAAVSERVLGQVPQWQPPDKPERSDAVRRLQHMLRQYGRTLRDIENERGWEWLVDAVRSEVYPDREAAGPKDDEPPQAPL